MRGWPWLLLVSCGGAPPIAAPPPPDPCGAERVQAAGLVAEGRLDRARRVLAAADERCPETRPARAELAQAVAEAFAAGAAYSELVRRGLEALPDDPAAAQRWFDQALVALRQDTGEVERPTLLARKHDFGGFGDFAVLAAYAVPDAERVRAVADPTGRIRFVAPQNEVTVTAGGGLLVGREPELFLPRPGAPAIHLEPLQSRFFPPGGDHVVGRAGDSLVVLSTASGDRIAEYSLGADLQLSRFHPARLVGDRLLVPAYRPRATMSLLSWAFPSLTAPREIRGAHLVVHPEGRWAVSVDPAQGGKATVHVHDLTGGGETAVGAGPPLDTPSGSHLAVDEAGRWVASVVEGDAVELIDMAAGKVHAVSLRGIANPAGNSPLSPVFTADGHLCVGYGGVELRVVEVAKQRLLGPAWKCQVRRGRAHATTVPLTRGHRLVRSSESAFVVADDGTVAAAIEQPRGDPRVAWLLIFEPGGPVRHRIDVSQVRMPRLDIRHGVAWVDFDHAYDLRTGEPSKPHYPPPPEPAFDEDAILPQAKGWRPYVAGSTVLWRGADRLMTLRLADGSHAVLASATCGAGLSSDGRYAAATPPCDEAGEVRVWDLRDGSVAGRAPVARGGEVVAVGRSGRLVLIGAGPMLEVLRLDGGARASVELEAPIRRLVIAPDEAQYVVDAGSLSLRSTAHPEEVRWSGRSGGFPQDLRFTENGSHVGAFPIWLRTATGESNEEVGGVTIRRNDVESFYIDPERIPAGNLELKDAISSGHPMTWSIVDGHLLADASQADVPYGTVVVHHLASRERLAVISPVDGGAVAFLPHGYVERFGSADPVGLVCRAGAHAVPFAVCRDRWAAPGGLARVWRGDRGYERP